MKIIHLNLALKDGEEPENRERFNSDWIQSWIQSIKLTLTIRNVKMSQIRRDMSWQIEGYVVSFWEGFWWFEWPIYLHP